MKASRGAASDGLVMASSGCLPATLRHLLCSRCSRRARRLSPSKRRPSEQDCRRLLLVLATQAFGSVWPWWVPTQVIVADHEVRAVAPSPGPTNDAAANDPGALRGETADTE